MKRIAAVASTLVIAFVLMVMFAPPSTHIVKIPAVHAQFSGATQVPGYFASGVNAVVNAAIGSAGAVTNPASNGIILIQGGPVYCGGAVQHIGQSTINLSLSTSYFIVWNCNSEQVYAKTAVTGPGTGTTPGTPATILGPTAGNEVGLATVVCNATACSNGGNGSITDARSTIFFPGAGTPLNTTTFANLPTTNVTDGTMIMCTSCVQPAAGATCTAGAANVLAVRLAGVWRCL